MGGIRFPAETMGVSAGWEISTVVLRQKAPGGKSGGAGWSLSSMASEFAGEGFGEDGGHDGVKLFGRLLLEFLEVVHLGLEAVKVFDDPALFG